MAEPPLVRGGGAPPLHLQLCYALQRRIAAGELAPGDQLPSEAQLAEGYGVSRHVVRQALQRLIAEGRVVAHKGSGYYVNRPRVRRQLPTLTSFTTAMARTGATVRTRIVRQAVVDMPPEQAERLCPPGDSRAVFVQRVGYLDGEPTTVLRGWYPMRYAEALLGEDLTDRSIYALLKDRYGVEPRNAESLLWVAFAGAEEAPLLAVPVGAALLTLESWTWDHEDQVTELSVSSYRSDRFEFSIEQRYPEGTRR
jgi:GntR family transcriptional regulator